VRSLSARVRRIERTMSKHVCACGGPSRLRVIFEGRDPDPQPCPKCGTTGTVLRFVRGEPPPAWGERRESQTERVD
jgi:hypothetical protein